MSDKPEDMWLPKAMEEPSMNEHRQMARIGSVFYGKEDHGILTAMIQLDFRGSDGSFGGSFQGFGGVVLDERTGPAWKDDIARLFKVTEYERVVGAHCWALKSWPNFWDSVEGLENMDGARFTLTDFRRRHFPEKNWDRLEMRVEEIQRDIAFHARRINEQTAELAKVRNGYIDWSKR